MSSNSGKPPLFWMPPTEPDGDGLQLKLVAAASRIIGALSRLTHAYLKDSTRTAELLEEAVKAAARSIQNQPSEVRSFDAYLFSVFARRLRKIAAVEKRLYSPLNLSGEALVDRQHDRLPVGLQVDDLLRLVDTRARTILEYRFCGHSWAEIGAMLNITPHAAEQHYHRAIKKLRTIAGGARKLSGSEDKRVS